MTIILLVMIYMLNCIDYFQTMYAVQNFGFAVEANPIARFVIENNCGWILKFIVMPIMLLIIGIIIRFDKLQSWIAYFLFVFYIYIVIHNFIILSQLGLL